MNLHGLHPTEVYKELPDEIIRRIRAEVMAEAVREVSSAEADIDDWQGQATVMGNATVRVAGFTVDVSYEATQHVRLTRERDTDHRDSPFSRDSIERDTHVEVEMTTDCIVYENPDGDTVFLSPEALDETDRRLALPR